MPKMIELAQNRQFTIREAGHRYSLTISPISKAVWIETFFDEITAVFKLGNGVTESQVDAVSPALGLIERMAIAAEGYPHLSGDPDWLSKIPLRHKLAFGKILVEAYEQDGSRALAIASDGTRVVRLEALWSAAPAGAMCLHRHLTHYLKPPTAEQKARFRRAYSGVQRSVSAARRGAPIFISPQQPVGARALVGLYDEMIVRVEGYAVNGEPLDDNRTEIASNMDTFHKVTAARPLFLKPAYLAEDRRTA